MKRNKCHIIGCILLFIILSLLIISGYKQNYSNKATVTQNIEYKVYSVEPGDTLWSISKTYTKGDPRELIYQIQKLNNTSADIVPGQILKIPNIN